MTVSASLQLPELPRHDEAERSVLGGILVRHDALFDITGTLRAEHFRHPYHQQIYRAMLKLSKANQPIDELTLHAAVANPEVTVGFISHLTDGVPRSTNITYHAGLVVNAAKLREAVLRAADVIGAATMPSAQASDVIEQAQAAYFQLSSEQAKKTLWMADEMTLELSASLEGDETAVAALPPISTGLPSVDALFDGLTGGDLCVVGGRPGTGKSSLVQQIGLHAAAERMVLSVVMEMKHAAMWRRALANVTRMHIPVHQRRQFLGQEQHHLGRGLARLGGLKLAIEDMPHASDMQVLATARRVQMQHGLGLVIVDYFQLMRADGKFSNRGDELSVVSRSLKQIAMQLDVPIILVAALSRAAATGRPNMAHLRECGTLEYDADHIFLMHRDVEEQKDLEPGKPSNAELIVEKQRNGCTGSVPLMYFGESFRFDSKAMA